MYILQLRNDVKNVYNSAKLGQLRSLTDGDVEVEQGVVSENPGNTGSRQFTKLVPAVVEQIEFVRSEVRVRDNDAKAVSCGYVERVRS